MNVFELEIGKLAEILESYKEDYHLEITDVLNQRLGNDCETLLHQATQTGKRANIVWYFNLTVIWRI